MFSLHNHTDGSNLHGSLDAINTSATLVSTSVEMGLSGCALTDHAILCNHYEFLQEVNKINKQGREILEKQPMSAEGLHKASFIGALGSEIYLVREGLTADNIDRGEKFYHFILIAKDRIGWEQLNEISTKSWERAFTRGVTRTPSYLSDLQEVIGKNPGHLVATSACLGGYLGNRTLELFVSQGEKRQQLVEEITSFIASMKSIFGEDFYLEVQPGLSQEQILYNQGLVAFAQQTQTPIIVATDAHYARPELREVHSAYLKSQKAERETEKFYEYTYIMSEQETRINLGTHLERQTVEMIIQNTKNIKQKFTRYALDMEPIIPTVPFEDEDKWESIIHRYDHLEYFNILSHSNTDDKFFLYRIIKGIDEYLQRGWLKVENEIRDLNRLNEEFDHIYNIGLKLKQNMTTYFTTMQKILDIMWQESVIGPGRGSGGAYLTNFILGITQDNPLDLPVVLPIYRFIHKDKISLPKQYWAV